MTNHEGHRRESDDLDRALDAALAKYTSVEPRAGLDERILANLRAVSRPLILEQRFVHTLAQRRLSVRSSERFGALASYDLRDLTALGDRRWLCVRLCNALEHGPRISPAHAPSLCECHPGYGRS